MDLPARITREQLHQVMAILGVDPNTTSQLTITPDEVIVSTIIPAVNDPGSGGAWPIDRDTSRVPVSPTPD